MTTDKQELRDDVLQAIDSVYAKRGRIVAQEEIQESVKSVFIAHGVE